MQFKRKLARIALVCMLIFWSILFEASAPAQAPQQPQILFTSNRDGNYEIYVMDADGKNQRNLTNNPALDVASSWSPDGQKIAFASDRGGGYEIYIMNSNWRDIRRLMNKPAGDGCPVWSPDGRQIAFCSYRDGNSEIYVMNANWKFML